MAGQKLTPRPIKCKHFIGNAISEPDALCQRTFHPNFLCASCSHNFMGSKLAFGNGEMR